MNLESERNNLILLNATEKLIEMINNNEYEKIDAIVISEYLESAERIIDERVREEIGSIFSRDHSTVMASCERVNTNIKTMIKTDSDIKKIIKEIKGS